MCAGAFFLCFIRKLITIELILGMAQKFKFTVFITCFCIYGHCLLHDRRVLIVTTGLFTAHAGNTDSVHVYVIARRDAIHHTHYTIVGQRVGDLRYKWFIIIHTVYVPTVKSAHTHTHRLRVPCPHPL